MAEAKEIREVVEETETAQMEGHGKSACFSPKDNAKALSSFQHKLPCSDFNFYMIILTAV